MTKSILLLMVLACGGCATLTKTQVKAVNQFAEASKGFSAYPAHIMTGLAAVRTKRGVYAANSIDDPRLHIAELDNIHTFNNESIALAAKVDLSCRILDKYAQSLLLLSSDRHVSSLDQQSKSFGISLDSLTGAYNRLEGAVRVPAGIGGAVGQLIAFGGKQYISVRQARELKKFVQQADTLVGVMTANLLGFLRSSNIRELISIEEQGVKDNYLSYLRQVKTVYTTVQNDSAVIRANNRPPVGNDREYLELRTAVDLLKVLQHQTALATAALREAHRQLLVTVQQKRTLTTGLAGIMGLQEDIQKVKVTITKIESVKTAMP